MHSKQVHSNMAMKIFVLALLGSPFSKYNQKDNFLIKSMPSSYKTGIVLLIMYFVHSLPVMSLSVSPSIFAKTIW